MEFSRTVLFSDLDGTLFNSAGEVSAENREAIDWYIRNGGKFAVSTGREPHHARRHLPGVSINAPSVVLNGAAVFDYSTGEYSHVHTLEKGVRAVLRRALRELPGLDLQVYTRRGIFYVTPEATAQPQLLSLHLPCSFVSWESLEEERWIKCLVYAPPEHEDALRTILTAGEGDGYRCVPGTTDVGGRLTYFELMPPGISKGSALQALRSHPALAGRTFLAAGDYWNDYELLRSADIPVAPENAIPEIRALCAHITASNNDHASAHILRELIPAL